MSRVLSRLDLETCSHHRAADADRIAALGMLTPYRYWTYLRQSYGIEAPTESAFAMTPGLDGLIDLRAREKSGLIADDLLVLGASPALIARLPLCRAIATFDTIPEALGWMYANERRALQHAELLHGLRGQVTTTSYLSAYVDQTGADRWAELGEVLDHLATTAGVVAQVVNAARNAFRVHAEWSRQDMRDECLA